MPKDDIAILILVSILILILIFILVFNRLETKKWKKFDYWIEKQEIYGSDMWIDFKKGKIVLDFSNKIVKNAYLMKVEEW